MNTTTFSPSDPLTWKQADADVHVATRAGEFAGFVEFDGTTHLVRDNHGTELGAFDTLDAACRALEGNRQARRVRTLTLPRMFRGPRRARA